MLPVLLDCPGLRVFDENLSLELRIPDLESAHPRVFVHMPAIALDCHAHRIRAMPFSRADLPSYEHNTRGQPFHIPLPWPLQGFVKVVDVKDETPFRRTESAKIADVAIAAHLNAYSSPGRRGEIRRHQGSSAAKEREWRLLHSAVSDRQKLGQSS